MGEQVDNCRIVLHWSDGDLADATLTVHRGSESLDTDFGFASEADLDTAVSKAKTSQLALDVWMAAEYGQDYSGLSTARKGALKNLLRDLVWASSI